MFLAAVDRPAGNPPVKGRTSPPRPRSFSLTEALPTLRRSGVSMRKFVRDPIQVVGHRPTNRVYGGPCLAGGRTEFLLE